MTRVVQTSIGHQLSQQHCSSVLAVTQSLAVASLWIHLIRFMNERIDHLSKFVISGWE